MKLNNSNHISIKCPICEELLSHKKADLYDDRYGFPEKFSLWACKNCNHYSLQENFSKSEIINLYTKYYPRSLFEVENYKPHREANGFFSWLDGVKCKAFRWVPRNVRILDIGCGFGETLGYHRLRGCDVHGVEADQNIQRVADRFGYQVRVGLFDPKQYTADYFDYVTLDQVIEHVQDPISMFNGIKKILKPGGCVILSTPNHLGFGASVFGRHWINWHTPYHLQFFSVESMGLMANKSGFRLEKTKTITSSEWLLYQWIHLLTFPRRGSTSSFWGGNKEISRGQKFAIRILYVIHRSKVNHLITRLLDALSIGDSRLYFLRKVN